MRTAAMSRFHANPVAWFVSLLVLACLSCRSMGPSTVPRDRIDYVTSIGDSWKQQTLLNVVRLRYGDVPIFLEVTQVIAGYQRQSTVGAGVTAGKFPSTAGLLSPFSVSGSAAATDTYTDRPTLMYSPLMGVDFLKALMTPIPPSAVLFLLQSGYSADLVMPMVLDSISGLQNESKRGVPRPADPRFARLTALMREAQLTGTLQFRIERPKGGPETSVVVFGPSRDPQVASKGQEIRSLLGLRPDARELNVYYGGYSGKNDEIDMTTRSMLQIMLELSAIVRVPESDVAQGRAAPGLVEPGLTGGAQVPIPITILSGSEAPKDAYVAVQYGGRWFWVPGTEIRSKYTFGFVMLLFSISDTGVKGSKPVVTVPAQ